MTLRPLATTLLLSISCAPAYALVDRGDPRDPRWIELPRVHEVSQQLDVESSAAGSLPARAFLARHGGRWQFSVDPRTGLATLVQGEGVPFISGPEAAADAASLAKLAD